ncbi:hypothetical protein ACHAWX_002111 [Stephanocyclus meneghinianus]
MHEIGHNFGAYHTHDFAVRMQISNERSHLLHQKDSKFIRFFSEYLSSKSAESRCLWK